VYTQQELNKVNKIRGALPDNERLALDKMLVELRRKRNETRTCEQYDK
jgi:hypothetical protein